MKRTPTHTLSVMKTLELRLHKGDGNFKSKFYDFLQLSFIAFFLFINEKIFQNW